MHIEYSTYQFFRYRKKRGLEKGSSLLEEQQFFPQFNPKWCDNNETSHQVLVSFICLLAKIVFCFNLSFDGGGGWIYPPFLTNIFTAKSRHFKGWLRVWSREVVVLLCVFLLSWEEKESIYHIFFFFEGGGGGGGVESIHLHWESFSVGWPRWATLNHIGGL